MILGKANYVGDRNFTSAAISGERNSPFWMDGISILQSSSVMMRNIFLLVLLRYHSDLTDLVMMHSLMYKSKIWALDGIPCVPKKLSPPWVRKYCTKILIDTRFPIEKISINRSTKASSPMETMRPYNFFSADLSNLGHWILLKRLDNKRQYAGERVLFPFPIKMIHFRYSSAALLEESLKLI